MASNHDASPCWRGSKLYLQGFIEVSFWLSFDSKRLPSFWWIVSDRIHKTQTPTGERSLLIPHHCRLYLSALGKLFAGTYWTMFGCFRLLSSAISRKAVHGIPSSPLSSRIFLMATIYEVKLNFYFSGLCVLGFVNDAVGAWSHFLHHCISLLPQSEPGKLLFWLCVDSLQTVSLLLRVIAVSFRLHF